MVASVMGARTGLGVVLDAEGGRTVDGQTLEGAVVEAHVGLGHVRHRSGFHREVVVLAGDLDAPGGSAANRHIATVVAEAHLEGPPAQGQGQQLVAEANPEDGNRADERPQRLHDRAGHRRVSRSVAEEHSVGLARQHLCRWCVGWHDGHGGQLAQAAKDGGLDAEVVGHHVARARARGVGAVGGYLADQIDAAGAGLGASRGQKRGLVRGAERSGHGARIADMAGEPAGVDPGDARHAVAAQEAVEAARGPPAARPPGEVAHDHAPAVGPGRLRVGVVGAVVAYVGIGEGDDLACVGGIGDHLLVPAHHRVEHDLAGGDLDVQSADGLALEHLPVAEHKQGRFGAGHRCGSPSITTGSPASSVWRTRPRRVRPS